MGEMISSAHSTEMVRVDPYQLGRAVNAKVKEDMRRGNAECTKLERMGKPITIDHYPNSMQIILLINQNLNDFVLELVASQCCSTHKSVLVDLFCVQIYKYQFGRYKIIRFRIKCLQIILLVCSTILKLSSKKKFSNETSGGACALPLSAIHDLPNLISCIKYVFKRQVTIPFLQ